MSVSLFRSRTPYVCNTCKIQLKGRLPSPRLGSRQTSTQLPSTKDLEQSAKFVKERVKHLGGSQALSASFPRWQRRKDVSSMSAAVFMSTCEQKYETLRNGSFQRNENITVYGRVTSRRKQGSMLRFYDLETGGISAQGVASHDRIKEFDDTLELSDFEKLNRSIRRGDWLAITGFPYRSDSGQLSILASELPKILSPSLQPVSLALENPEIRNHQRHVERIIDQSANHVLKLRHRLIQALRNFFLERDFLEVNTPLLVAGAGGAVARPFETEATEFSDLKLNLRIAPELFLKRLIVGNVEKVFEIGPAFRNEGVDSTHNPEFSICEFYQIMTDLPELITMTEQILHTLSTITTESRDKLSSIPSPMTFTSPFPQLPFIPTLESAICQRGLSDWNLPDLSNPGTTKFLLVTFTDLSIPHPSDTSLPHLLDVLASHLLEPLCTDPTWIIHHPECMSPLAKSFICPSSGQPVAARAELFIAGREYVNTYEEENSPLEQRRKFEAQNAMRQGNEVSDESGIDEDYLGALEWGMPPTGGWGCGVDRMVMLFAGKSRIADVLPFGTLNNVVGLGSKRHKSAKVKASNK